MKKGLIIFFFLITFCESQEKFKKPKTVAYVNPKSFSGLWYEIARTYNSYEKNCLASTIEYTYINDNKYKIKNRCFKEQIGKNLKTYSGTAKALEKNSISKIEKTYYWIFSKDYLVLYLDDYLSAIISDEEMKNVWIMNRTPFMEEEKLNFLISFLKQYMDTSRLIYTKQDKNGRYK